MSNTPKFFLQKKKKNELINTNVRIYELETQNILSYITV